MTTGQIVGGEISQILVRQQSKSRLEIGDLLVSQEDDGSMLILQVFNLTYGSQLEAKTKELISGVSLEGQPQDATFYESHVVNYVLASVKALVHVGAKVKLPKNLPPFFNKLRMITTNDLRFLQQGGSNKIFVGNIRSGSKVLDAEVWLDAVEIFSHHVLIPATTGRGKSNLVKVILYHLLNSNSVGTLVLDAHNEYYGDLNGHRMARNNLKYYTPGNPPPGALHLTISLETIMPDHFEGIVELTEPQVRAMKSYRSRNGEKWISKIMLDDPTKVSEETKSATLFALQQKLRLALDLDIDYANNVLVSKNKVFDSTRGDRTVNDIVGHIESGKVVVLDTSTLSDQAELIVGCMAASRLLDKYREAKTQGTLGGKPVATIVIEEAPRVIGDDVLQSGTNNIYSTIAREGRKFKVGLTAVTQLSSVIPKTILANMNTKIILGNEMQLERQALISSASQDLSDDDRNIASLDRGEALITSIFVPFALPIKIPSIEEVKKKEVAAKVEKLKVF